MTIINPVGVLCRVVKDLTWIQTCHSDTCGCMSHDPGYYVGVVDPATPAGKYALARLKTASSDVTGWGSSRIVSPLTERSGRNRGERAAEVCRTILRLTHLSRNEKGEFCRQAMAAGDPHYLGEGQWGWLDVLAQARDLSNARRAAEKSLRESRRPHVVRVTRLERRYAARNALRRIPSRVEEEHGLEIEARLSR